MNEREKRVLFVLGSGVSKASGAPMVKDVRDLLFSQDIRVLQGDRHGQNFKPEERDCIHGFLHLLKKEIQRMGEVENYESLYSLAQRLYEFEVSRLKDASMVRFRDHVYRETASCWSHYAGGGFLGDSPLAAISAKTCEYINKCIRVLLAPLDSPQELQLIPDLINQYGAKNVDILTLNHDKLVEILLKNKGIAYTTGFDPKIANDGQVDFYDDAAFDEEDRVRIVKPHGCVSWWKFRKEGSSYWAWGRLNDEVDWYDPLNDWMDPRANDGRSYRSSPFEEPVTTGNTTKIEAYTRGITGEMYIQARRLLKEHDRIISSGYGFRDDGFNRMLSEWSRHLPEKKMLLLHDTSEIPIEQRCWFWPEGWMSNHSGGWFKHHPKWLSDTDCSDVERLLFS